MKKLIPLTLLAACLAIMVAFRWAGAEKFVGYPVRYTGVLPIAAGGILALLGLYHLRRAGTTVKAFHEPGRLVTRGIYRYTRNPVYLGLVLVLVGACFLFGARCLLPPVLLFVMTTDRLVIRAEERMLSREFGEVYTRYRSNTPRWI